jgi:N4-(beta-N-acetylglucosaminyl)-L-asparaginase
MLCVDQTGSVAAGVSTSGPAFKIPGRVGDSPLPGCGFYANNRGGAAAATGDGDLIMQFCPSFHVVQLLEEGVAPQEACSKVVCKMKQLTSNDFEVGLIAMDTKVRISLTSV